VKELPLPITITKKRAWHDGIYKLKPLISFQITGTTLLSEKETMLFNYVFGSLVCTSRATLL
jgi:hypothetical protein